MRRAALCLLLAVAGCAPRTPASSAPGDGRVAGTVRVVGSAPVNVQVVVQEPGGRSVRVDGPMAAEVRELSGAEVEVWGRMSDGPAVEAAGYTILSVNGEPVEMGVVERAPGGGVQLRTSAGVVRLTGAASSLRVGQKVWVQGPTTVQVQSYGVIRP